MKVSILTIGTEVVTGEILNTNARWLSEQLEDLNFDVIRHLTVPDERQLMLDSLRLCAQDSQLIVVTGGLGPTADDFTRDIVAEWCQLPLEFNELSWQKIVTRLQRMNIVVADANRQQCFFPKGCHILNNDAGTADGFALQVSSGKNVVVLPGPPVEIKAIWDQGLLALLKDLAPPVKKLKLWYWHCIGLSESRLGEIVEKALEGSGYTTGYRPHIPYVDVKVWTPSHINRGDAFLERLDHQISPWTIARDGVDIRGEAMARLRSWGIALAIEDFVSHGCLAERCGAQSIDFPLSIRTHFRSTSWQQLYATLLLWPLDKGWKISLLSADGEEIESEIFDFGREITNETQQRFRRFATEKSLWWISRLDMPPF